MLQFYFLAIVLNILGGYALTVADRSRPHHLLRNLDASLESPKGRLTLGMLSLITGIFKLISPIRGDMRVIGDLLPATTCILVGAVLLLELRRGPDDPFVDQAKIKGPGPEKRAGEELPAAPQDRFAGWLLSSGRKIGYVAMLAGLAHFIFPMELFF